MINTCLVIYVKSLYYENKIWMGKNEDPIFLLPQMANRHGLVAGATGTGKQLH